MIDIFKIGVSIGMTNNVSSVLKIIQRDLFGLNKQVDLTTGKFNMMKAAAIGAMGVVGGGAALAAMGKLVQAGADVVHQQQLMRAAGMSHLDVANATARAWQTTSRVMGSNITENLKSIRELRTVFGSTSEANKYMPQIMKAEVALESILGHHAAGQAFDFAKAGEIKGVSMVAPLFFKYLDAEFKAMNAFGAKVTASDFLSAFKFGRSATQGWDMNFVSTILPTLIQEMKGGGGFSGATGPGNALMSAYAAIVGGQMSNKAAIEFLRLGLVNPNAVIHTTTGHVKGILPGGVRGANLFQANPYEWVQQYLMPELRAKGITTPAAIREEVAHLFVNRTSQQIIGMFATMQARFEKDARLVGKAHGVDQTYRRLTGKDFFTNWSAFTTSIGNFIRALGAPIVPQATHWLHILTVDINRLTLWASKHPGLVRTLDDMATGLGLLAVSVGAFTVGAAAASALGLLNGPMGLAALGVGIGVLGDSLGKIPPWFRALIHVAADAATGAGVGLRTGGAPGAVIGGAAGALAGLPGSPAKKGLALGASAFGAFSGPLDMLVRAHPTWFGLPADAFGTPAAQPVHVSNAHEIAHHVVGAMKHALTLPAAHVPTTPTGAATPWSPGIYPISP